MNILKDRQAVIFNKIIDFITNNDSTIIIESISLPKIQHLDINEAFYLCLTQNGIITPEMMIKINDQSEFVDLKYVKNLFDVLGKFSMRKPCSVYLCDGLIDACAKKNSFDVKVLEEVVYIHECAQYIHYHLNSANFRNCPFNVQERSLYVETFAQLITHVICKEISDEHFKVFEKLKEGQQDVYTLYNDYAIAFSKHYLLNLFLNPQPNSDVNVIDFIKKDYDIKNINPEEFIPWHWESLTGIIKIHFRLIDERKNGYILNKELISLDKILCPIVLQKLINKDPIKMRFILKSVWNELESNQRYEGLKWPIEYEQIGNLLRDLDLFE